MSLEKADLCVIGGGPAGYAAAMRGLDFNKKVILVEQNRIGGAGVHDGALSSKAWWEISRTYLTLKEKGEIFQFDRPKVDFKRIKKEISTAVFSWQDMLEHHVRVLREKHKTRFSFLLGTAKIIDRNKVSVLGQDGRETTLHVQNIVLATGSRPRRLSHIPIDEKIIVTSDGIHHFDDFPHSMVVLGAGVIGCEFATIFSNFGRTKVHMIDKGNRILPFEDEDVVAVIEKNMERKGILIHRNSRLSSMYIQDGEVSYELEYSSGRKELFHVEKALVSVGRVPNYENLGLEKLGVQMDARGVVDNLTQTSVPNVYAVGDLTADIALVNVGQLEGRYAVERIFDQAPRDLVYENVSTIMFLHPEVAGVGINEITAQKKKIPYRVASLNYECIPRAVAMRNTQGFVKILVTDDEDMKVLGMRVVGEGASSAVQGTALLIYMDKGVEELAELIHPHPSIIEGIQECARMLLGKSTLRPSLLPGAMSCRAYRSGKYSDI
ncbi:MAG: NAD(P)/FAD-dependent oxidoreductase [Cytophagales bacterium]|nr:NAD(P)/FAD-dependent oxidoreductase [Cytophagales bacterium]